MLTKVIPDNLQSLVGYLDNLDQRASVPKLRELLTESGTTFGDLASFAEFSEAGYTRNLVCEGPWYHLLVLCWRSGQRSPIHNHAESTCGVKVLKGIATETAFTPTPCGQMKAVASTDLLEGQICAAQDADTHQISNMQAAEQDLVTMHIYSPPLTKMEQYSITGSAPQSYVPTPVYIDGGGI